MTRWTLLVLVGCTDVATTVREPVEAGANVPDAAAVAIDAGRTPVRAVITSVPSSIPFAPAQMVPLAVGTPLDYDSAFHVDEATGAWVVVLERFTSVDEFTSELRMTRSTDGRTFAETTRAPLGDDPAYAGPSVTTLGGKPWLLLMHGDPSRRRLRLARVPILTEGFGPLEDLDLDDAAGGHDAWPTMSTLPDGRVVLSYDHYQAEAMVAFGDGLRFGSVQRLGSGVQGRVAVTTAGGLVYTFQNGVDPQTVYVRRALDGVTFDDPTSVSASLNVHDATPFPRRDGGVDVYYVANDGAGFRAHRRAVTNTAFGPEQRLSDDAAGSLTQPRPHRLADGSIVLTFAKQVTSNVDTDSYLVHLDGTDAPLP